MAVYNRMVELGNALEELRGYRTRLKDDLAKRAAELEGGEGSDTVTQPETLTRVRGSLSTLLSLLQGSDDAPTTQAMAAVTDRLQASDDVLKRWAALRAELQKANLQR